jgi:ribonuclease HI
MAADLKQGYYLLFVDGGKRANEQGEAEGAIGVVIREPGCGAVVVEENARVGLVGSPLEAEYRALIRGLELAAEEGLAYVAAFSDSVSLVNQVAGVWNKSERAAELYEEVALAQQPFKTLLLSWIPREMNRDADELVDRAFSGEPVSHATDS